MCIVQVSPCGIMLAQLQYRKDLYYLIKKAVSIRKHLDKNRKALGQHERRLDPPCYCWLKMCPEHCVSSMSPLV